MAAAVTAVPSSPAPAAVARVAAAAAAAAAASPPPPPAAGAAAAAAAGVPAPPASGGRPPPPRRSIEVLASVKAAQLQHGLRHGDHMRYRQYCSRRLRRMRAACGVHPAAGRTHKGRGRGKFKQQRRQQQQPPQQQQQRHAAAAAAAATTAGESEKEKGKNKKRGGTGLGKSAASPWFPADRPELALFSAERAWARAMEMKDEHAIRGGERALHHMKQRFATAVRCARAFEELCAQHADERTHLEAQAYASWMEGNFLFVKEQWRGALVQLLRCKTIYENLSKVQDDEQRRDLFRRQADSLAPSIRYCHYLLGEQSQDLAGLAGEADDLLRAKLEAVVVQELRTQAESVREIRWRGRCVPLDKDAVRVAIVGAREAAVELEKPAPHDVQMQRYDTLFLRCNEALQAVRGALAPLQDGAGERKLSRKDEVRREHLTVLRAYISHLKLGNAMDRTLLNIAAADDGADHPGEKSRRRARPEEVVKMCDSLLANLAEMAELLAAYPHVGANAAASRREGETLVAQETAHKACRCYWLALSFDAAGKWSEAAALLERAETLARNAQDHHDTAGARVLSEDVLARLRAYLARICSAKCVVRANAALAAHDASRADETPPADRARGARSVLDSLDAFDTSFVRNRTLIPFPPDFEPIRCKPLLFDLASAHLEYPTLESVQTKPKAGGFWSFFGR